MKDYAAFFHSFPRKKSINQKLFGYQALGGSELTDPRNDPKFGKQNVT
jgi:hypothetical protein